MSILNSEEKAFLNKLCNPSFVMESTKLERKKILNLAMDKFKENGFNPNVSKSTMEGWVSGKNDDCCIAALGSEYNKIEKSCTEINKLIKPLCAKISPDNYGTAFIHMVDKEVLEYTEDDEVVTESYVGNYIKNKFLLYKMGKHPEMTRKAMVSFMKTLTSSFKESLKDPEIKKLQKNPKRDQLFAIKYSTTFDDGMEVYIAFCYDERSFTPGAAYYDTGLKQYVIILYPNFFESGNIEQMLFIFLHELGHIRLGHCDYRNFHPDPDRRLNQMLDGKVEYGELNADLYAALNGAKLYSILGEYIPADADKKYNYTYTNQELANRYIHTAKGYRKLRGEKYIEESSLINDVTYIDNFVILEHRSKLSFDYTSKGTKNLSDFDKEKITKSFIDKYKNDYKFLKHIHPEDESYAFLNENEIIGVVSVANVDKYKWIRVIEVSTKYKGYGLGNQLLDFSVKELGGNALTVDKDNEIALRMYSNYGFKISKESKDDVKLGNKKVYFMYLELFNEKTNLDVDDSDIKRIFGYTSDDGIYNACVEVKGEKKILRGRSEVVIIKDDEIFLCFDNKNPDDYRLPGGSWDDGEDHSKAAIREAKEEARITCKNPEFIQSYTEVYNTPKKWVKENIPEQFWWYGYYTKFYIAEYSGKYSGKVDKEDQDKSMAKNGDFYKISEVMNKLRPVHKEGLTNYLEYKKESTIDYDMDDNLEILESLMMESPSDSHIILDAIYPNVEKVLSTPMGDKEFRRLVENFVDRNTDKLYEPCPISMIPFTDAEKAKYFNLFGFNEKQLAKEIESGLKAVSDTANFRLLKQNPIFSVFYMVLRFYILKNDESGINATLIIHALSSYPSIFSKYFKYGANEGIMRYTADHLTEKFIFKQEKHVFGALRKSIESAYVFLKPFFKEASDKEVVRYIQRVRNDQNSMIKKIASEYHKNRDAGNSVSTQAETWDNGSLIDDYQNDTSKVESLASRVVISILTNGIDLSRLKVAATFAQLSITELRYYLVKILIDSKNTEIDEFVTAVLFIYLYDEKHTVEEIRSKMYISFGIELFRKTNANNTNIKTIKTNLDKWAEETGIHAKYRREPTRIAYKKGIYWYILLTIQANV